MHSFAGPNTHWCGIKQKGKKNKVKETQRLSATAIGIRPIGSLYLASHIERTFPGSLSGSMRCCRFDSFVDSG